MAVVVFEMASEKFVVRLERDHNDAPLPPKGDPFLVPGFQMSGVAVRDIAEDVDGGDAIILSYPENPDGSYEILSESDLEEFAEALAEEGWRVRWKIKNRKYFEGQGDLAGTY